MDDIYDAKFHGERHQSYRVIHGEQSFSGAKFIVTIYIYKMSFCQSRFLVPSLATVAPLNVDCT